MSQFTLDFSEHSAPQLASSVTHNHTSEVANPNSQTQIGTPQGGSRVYNDHTGVWPCPQPELYTRPRENVVNVDDGVVEVFIHIHENAKYVGARYFTFDGIPLREVRFIRRLVSALMIKELAYTHNPLGRFRNTTSWHVRVP